MTLGCCQMGCGDGVLALVLENLMCQYFSCMFCSQLARVKTTEQAPQQHSQLGKKKKACLPFWAGQRCLHLPLGMSPSARTPQTGLRLKTSLFFGFFCLFWVYTIIKKSLVLAGNGKTKQNKETTLPWLIAAVLWPDLVKLLIYPPNFGSGD